MTAESLRGRVGMLSSDVLTTALLVAQQPADLVERGRRLYERFQALAAENAGKDREIARLLADIQLDITYIFNRGNSPTSTRLAQALRDQAAQADWDLNKE